MPIGALPGGAFTSSRRMNTFFAGRLNVSTTRPPTASWDSALALKLGLLGSPVHEPALGTLVSAPGSLATGSNHVAPLASLSLVLLREAAVPAGSLSVGLWSVLLHPARASTAAISPAPPRRMRQPPFLDQPGPPAQPERQSIRQNGTP